jgi:hypothetical protein
MIYKLDFLVDTSDDTLLAELRRVAESLGKDTITQDEFQKHGRCSPALIKRRYGSWNSALERAELRVGRRVNIPDEDIFAEIGRVWSLTGHQPTREEFDKHSIFSSALLKNRFDGSYRIALKRFCEQQGQDGPHQAIPSSSGGVELHSGSTPQPVPELEETSGEGHQVTDRSVHTEIQWLLLKLGSDMGYGVWVARNDRGRQWEGYRFVDLPNLQQKLPRQFDEETNRTIELIDVLWLTKNGFVAAFEIESTTSIYSGLLRMSDLLSMHSNLNIPLFIVAPDQRRYRVKAEINRPTFAKFSTPLSKVCRYIAYSSLKDFIDKHLSLASHLNADVIASDEVSESCEIEET